MPKRGKGLGPRIAAVRRALRVLEKSLQELSRAARSARPANPPEKAKGKRSLKLSPARRQALKLHGRYLGFIRQLKPRQRADVKAVREKKGVEAAIKRARRLVGG